MYCDNDWCSSRILLYFAASISWLGDLAASVRISRPTNTYEPIGKHDGICFDTSSKSWKWLTHTSSRARDEVPENLALYMPPPELRVYHLNARSDTRIREVWCQFFPTKVSTIWLIVRILTQTTWQAENNSCSLLTSTPTMYTYAGISHQKLSGNADVPYVFLRSANGFSRNPSHPKIAQDR